MFYPSHSENFQREIYRFGHIWLIFGGSVVTDQHVRLQHVRLIENRTFQHMIIGQLF